MQTDWRDSSTIRCIPEVDSESGVRLERCTTEAARAITITEAVRPHRGPIDNKEKKNEDSRER